MARNRNPRRPEAAGPGRGNGGTRREQEEPAPGTTGRYLMLVREGAEKAATTALEKNAGLTVAHSGDFTALDAELTAFGGAATMMIDELGVAVIDAPQDQIQVAAAAAAPGTVIAMEPERIVYAIETPWMGSAVLEPGVHAGAVVAPAPDAGAARVGQPAAPATPVPLGPPVSPFAPATVSLDYLRGYRDGVARLVDHVLAGAEAAPAAELMALRETEFTWGLVATRVSLSSLTGKGIKVAVLDTGLDLRHPDFSGREIEAASFVPGEGPQDGHGHGTHCAGTACGPQRPGGNRPRYGIAYEASVFVGKVLSNRGSGTDGSILAGIAWAVRNGCAVVSMSLGAPVAPGQPHSAVYEDVARRAMAAGTLIVAAAGNDSGRPFSIQPVSHPANCPSILAVGAVDSRFAIASFSNGGLNADGGQVDLAGPGVGVFSSWPRPLLYRTLNGTSMATPHVAGIAALLAQQSPGLRGRALWTQLTCMARPLGLPTRDAGAGLVQAP